MADTLPPLVQEYRAKADQLLDEQRKVRRSTKDMTDDTTENTGRMRSGFANIAGGVAVGTLAVDALKVGLSALGGAMKASIGNASDLREAATAVGEVFGSSYADIEKWAQTSATAMGTSTLQALNAAKTFGVYGQAAGLSAEANAEFSKTLAQTASDLASFHNADPSEVIEAIGSGLRGEAEPLRRFGILLNDASLKAQAMKMGIASGNEPLTNQQKILASNALILESVGAAAGDFGRTSGGLANQQRILAAQFTNLSASIGTVFLPALELAMGFVTGTVMPVVNNLASALADNVGPAFDVVKEAVVTVVGAFQSGNISKTLGEAFNIPSDSPIIGFLESLASAASMVGGIITGTLWPAMQELWKVFGPLIGQVAELWMSFSPLAMIFNAIAPVLPTIIELVTDLAVSIGGILADGISTVLPILSKVAEMMSGELAKIIQTLVPIVVQLAQTVAGVLSSALAALMPLVVKVAGFIAELLQVVMPLIGPILELVSAVMQLIGPIIELVGQLLTPLIELLSAVLDPIMGLVKGVLSFLVPALSWFIKLIVGTLQPVIKGLITVLSGIIDFVVGVFTGKWEKAWSGIVKIFTGIWGAVKGVVAGVINGVIDLINGIIGGVNNLANGIRDATGGAIDIRLAKIPRVSFDVGTDRVPGATGAPLAAIIHGGEAILSNDMLAGRAPIPERVREAVDAQNPGGRGRGGGDTYQEVNVHVQTNASPAKIAREVGWELKKDG